jgi:DNA gyrase/topoisomerase IV subunit B
LLNVRGENTSRISLKRIEIADLKKFGDRGRENILKTQDNVQIYLRYAKVMILTDADDDGINIRRLCVKLFGKIRRGESTVQGPEEHV